MDNVTKNITPSTQDFIREAFQPRADYYEIAKWGSHIHDTLKFVKAINFHFTTGAFCWETHQIETAIKEFSEPPTVDVWITSLDSLPKKGSSGIFSTTPITSSLVAINDRPIGLMRAHQITVAHVIHAAKWWRDEIERNKISDHAPETNKKIYRERYFPNLEAACRSIRLMSDDTLASIALDIFDPEEYYLKLSATVEQKKHSTTLTDRNKGYIKNIERMLAFAYKKRGPHEGPVRRTVKSRDSEIAKKITLEIVELGDKKPASLLQRYIDYGTEDPIKKTQMERRHRANGLATAEEVSGIEHHREASPINMTKGDSPLQSKIRSQLKTKHMTKNAQMTPYRWEKLSRVEIRDLWEQIKSQPHKKVSIALALIMITGRSLGEVINTRVVKTRKQLPLRLSETDLFIVTQDASWVSGVIEPESRRQLNSQWEEMFEPTSNNLTFKIPTEFQGIIMPAARRAEERSEKRSAAFLSGVKQSDIRDDCQTQLSNLTSRHRSRITLLRIQKILFDTATTGDQDIADACLISGNFPPTGNVSSLYYYAPKTKHLRDIYNQAVDVIQEAAIGFSPRQLSMIEDNQGNERVGSPITPSNEFISEIVQEFKQRYQESVSNTHCTDFLIKAHNAFTVYNVMLMMFSTGYRSIRDPLSDFLHVNTRRRTIVIADKVDDSLTNSRVIPTTDVFINQLSHYRAHCTFIKDRMGLFFNQSSSRPFFFLNNNMKPKHVTPERLQRHLSLKATPPLNMNRHYLRTRLRDQGVPGEYVDIFMGHWSIDQAPTSRHSTFCTNKYLISVRDALDTILFSNNWEAIRGLS